MRYCIVLILILSWINTLGQTNPNHVYVRPHIKRDGTFIRGHYRTQANKTNIDNFSTLGNTNPYTGKPGWIKPDTYYPTTSYLDRYIDLGIESIKTGDYEAALKYSAKITDKDFQNLIKFRAFHGMGDFQNALYYAHKVRNKAKKYEHKKSMDEWINALEMMVEASNELKLKSEKFNSAINSREYKSAIREAKSIKSPILEQTKHLYLAYAYELDEQYNNAINHYYECINYEMDNEVVEGYISRIEFCKSLIKYPKANINLEPGDFVEILRLHAQDANSDLDTYLREFGFKISEIEMDGVRITYERITATPEKFELMIFSEDKRIDDSTRIKVVTLEHTSFEYHKQLKKNFEYYRYHKDNAPEFLPNCIGNEYAYELFILYDCVKTNASEIFVFGGYLFLTNNNDVLSLNLSLYENN